MRYVCRDCGLTYDRLPNFCDCGNDTFDEIYDEIEESKERSAEFRRNSYRKKVEREKREQFMPKEEKANPISVILFFLLVAFLAGAIPSFIAKAGRETRQRDINKIYAYIDNVQKEIERNFDPKGITVSGRCVAKFEINSEGWINNRVITKKATDAKLNTKVMNALKNVTIVPPPPEEFKDTPIPIEFYCGANEREVECYSKIVTKTTR
jgi:TonB family protein